MQENRPPLIPHGAAHFAPARVPATPKRFVFLLCPSFTFLAFASALEPLRIANQLSQRALFHWTAVSVDGQPVPSSSGVAVQVDAALAPFDREDTLIVCAGNQPSSAMEGAIVAAVQRHLRHGGRIAGLCTGAFALARAGLLDGRRFTLHWENQPAFCEAFPDLTPSGNKFEIDGPVITCGGGAAATDLMLELISRAHGEGFASVVSDMCLRRVSLGQDPAQRSSISVVTQARHPGLTAIVELMKQHLEEPLSMEDLAERVGYSRRQVERLFRQTMNETPAKFYSNLRLDHARALLSGTDLSLSEVSVACGFETKSHFSKAFAKRFGVPPSRIHSRV
jgi:AraC family transcriptional regulator, carnitine catabolism transcriptional activator